MGNVACNHGSEEDVKQKRESNRIHKLLLEDNEKGDKQIKILLLGTGESGKSTFFKQLYFKYKEDYSLQEKTMYKNGVRKNIVEGMQVLIRGLLDSGLSLASKENNKLAAEFLDIDYYDVDFWDGYDIEKYITILWKDKGIQDSYDNRYLLQFSQECVHFFKDVKRISDPQYVPTKTDILRCRLRTSGIVETSFSVDAKSVFKFVDVGGQRNERRKWIHCFEGITAVIFITAISEYDRVLYEDPDQNRLVESMDLFEEILGISYFRKSSFILFLNKSDLFRDKIKKRPISILFEDYKVQNEDDDFEASSKFIQNQFLARAVAPHEGKITVHITTATNDKNILTIWEAVKRKILENNLQKLGFM